MGNTDKPNIVLLVWDAAKGSHFGYNGYNRDTTPYVDKLAEEGFSFSNAYSTTCWTHPSHVSFFSGRQMHKHGITSMGQNVSDVSMKMLEQLDAEGYTRYAFSNNGHLRSENGYDEHFDEFYFIDEESDNSVLERAKELNEEGYSTYKKYLKAVYESAKEEGFSAVDDILQVLGRPIFYSDSGARKTVSEISENVEEEPFFLFVNFTEPHMPYRPPHIYSQIFQDRPRYFSIIDSLSRKLRKYISEDNVPDKEYKKIMKALYDGELRYLDSKTKELHNLLEKRFGDTVLMVTSDHGEYMFEQDMTSHLSGIHREVLHVPLVVHGAEKGKEDETFSLKNLPDLVLNLPGMEYEVGDAGAEFAGISSATDDLEFLNQEELVRLDQSKISALNSTEQVIIGEGEPDKDDEGFSETLKNLEFPGEQKEEVEEEIKSNLEKLGYI